MATNKVVEAVENALKASVTGFSNETIAAAVSKAREDKAKKTADMLAGLFEQTDQLIQKHVAYVRNANNVLADTRKNLHEVVRRIEFAKESGNIAVLHVYCDSVVDILNAVGIDIYSLTHEELNVPKDWNPTDETKET